MLALTRREGESIMIGDDIEIFVVGVRGDKVRLGFSAPREIPIDRKEVWLDKQRKAKEAQSATGT